MANHSTENETLLRHGFLWCFVTATISTLFYMQGIRDIPIAPGIAERLAPLLLTLLAAPLLAVVLTFMMNPIRAILIGATLTGAGRILLFSTDPILSGAGLKLIFAAYPLFFTGTLSYINRGIASEEYKSRATALFASGVVAAPLMHLASRQIGNTADYALTICACVLSVAAVVQGTSAGRPLFPTGRPAAAGRGSGLKTLALLLIGIPFHFAFMTLGKPEFLASRCELAYNVVAFAVIAGLSISIILAFTWKAAPPEGRKSFNSFLLAGNALTAAYFFFLYAIPQAPWQILAVILAAVVTGLNIYRLADYAISQSSIWLTPVAGLSLVVVAFATFGIDAGVLLENHVPTFHGWLMLPLVAFSLLTLGEYSRRDDTETPRATWLKPAITFFIVILTLPALAWLMRSPSARRAAPEVEPLVFASLYTWYGTPGGTYGSTFPGAEFSKEGADDDYVIETQGMDAVEIGGGAPGFFRASGTIPDAARPGADSFSVGFDLPGSVLHSKPLVYVTIAYKMNRQPRRAWLEIIDGGKRYKAKLNYHQVSFGERIAFPDMFEESALDDPAPDETPRLAIYIQGEEPGEYDIEIDFLRFSRWRHWDEDFRAYFDEEKQLWFNDPPHTLAAAHRVTYNGSPWSDIKSYSPRGYYDSLDTNVMLSQLQLMERAGIDVVTFMHPYSPDVIRKGMRLIRENAIDLRVSWYWTRDDPNELIDEMKTMGQDPLWAKAGGKPIVIVGPTGLRELPFVRYREKFNRIRDAGIFIVGDSYVPPKEEMLSIMDGHYYYDTTGLYRARWGGLHSETAKPDGSFVTGFGHLFTIFDAVSRVTHARGGVFLATVIPGFDNVSVHGFKGSPLYDGRPGTIVKRRDGATYAETWQAAIDAGADWICIVSWNELHEGTEIEPTVEDGVKYVELTREWAEKFHAARGDGNVDE